VAELLAGENFSIAQEVGDIMDIVDIMTITTEAGRTLTDGMQKKDLHQRLVFPVLPLRIQIHQLVPYQTTTI
jgi:hypothetical protein